MKDLVCPVCCKSFSEAWRGYQVVGLDNQGTRRVSTPCCSQRCLIVQQIDDMRLLEASIAFEQGAEEAEGKKGSSLRRRWIEVRKRAMRKAA